MGNIEKMTEKAERDLEWKDRTKELKEESWDEKNQTQCEQKGQRKERGRERERENEIHF